MRTCGFVVFLAIAATFGPRPAATEAPAPGDQLAPGSRVWLHAHNCYPDRGVGRDRIERALGTGLPWVAIEQDLVWAPDRALPDGGASVVAHGTPLRGDEPSLEAHFFDRVRPLLERALAEGQTARWPVLVLHLEFKTNQPEHHKAVWNLLGRYERYLTTAVKAGESRERQALRVRPLLVLTENGAGAEADFFERVPAGASLRLFGTVPSPELPDEDRGRRNELSPDTLIRGAGSNYRRWANLPWDAVERDAPEHAGEWNQAADARLRALVARAHALGLWIRFYALDGYPPGTGRGWSASYNFGSLDAARVRWRAAIDAGVDFVATDQYELFAEELKK